MRSLCRPAALLGFAFLFAGAAQASDVKEVHRTVPLDRDGRLRVKTYKGSVTVATWDQPQAEISARVEPDGDDRYDREKVKWTEVRISGSGSSVEIKSDYDEVKYHDRHFLGFFGFHTGSLPFVHYRIQMPATARLEIEDYKSETKIADLKSDLKLHTYKGTASIANLDGAAEIDTYKGQVHLDFSRFTRASRFHTYKGDFEVRVPRDSRFDLDADAGRRGEIQSDFAMTTRASRHHRQRASGAVNGGGPELRFSTYKGSLRLRQL